MSARFEFNRYAGILRRAIDFKANCSSINRLGLFLRTNIIARKESRNKMKHISRKTGTGT